VRCEAFQHRLGGFGALQQDMHNAAAAHAERDFAVFRAGGVVAHCWAVAGVPEGFAGDFASRHPPLMVPARRPSAAIITRAPGLR
jgi:hypothetical protein